MTEAGKALQYRGFQHLRQDAFYQFIEFFNLCSQVSDDIPIHGDHLLDQGILRQFLGKFPTIDVCPVKRGACLKQPALGRVDVRVLFVTNTLRCASNDASKRCSLCLGMMALRTIGLHAILAMTSESLRFSAHIALASLASSLLLGLKGFDILAWHQPNFMPQFSQCPCPVMRSATALHADKARFPVDEEFMEPFAAEFPVEDFSCLPVNPMHLEYFLCQINADCCDCTIIHLRILLTPSLMFSRQKHFLAL